MTISRSKVEYARQRGVSIHKALTLAESVKLIDDILLVNEADLKMIGELGPDTHARLLAYADKRKTALQDQVVERLGA